MKLLIWLIYPVAEAIIQAYLQKKHNWKPNYFQLFVIRGIFFILFCAIVLRMPYDMVLWWSAVGFCTGSFFAVFDPLLNELRNKSFGYTGKQSGWINKIIGESKGLYIAFLAFCVLLAMASFIVYIA